MSECVEKLREIVKQYKGKAIDKEAFRDQVFNVLVEHISEPFTEGDVNIIIKLLDQMKKMGVADAETCDEIAGHFKKKVAAAPAPQPKAAGTPPAPPSPAPGGGEAYMHTSPGGLPPYSGDPDEAASAHSGIPSPPVGGVAGDAAAASRMADKGAEVMALKNLTKWFTIILPSSIVLGFLPIIQVASGFVMLAGWIMGLMILYACWHHVQDGKARTTPLKAVGFLFIPLFNLYWIFVAFSGLAKEIRRRLLELGVGAQSPKGMLSSVFCILVILSNIAPFLVYLLLFMSIGMAFSGSQAGAQGMMGMMTIVGIGMLILSLSLFVIFILMMRDFTRSVSPVILKSDRVSKPNWGKFVMLLVCIFVGAILVVAALAFLMGGIVSGLLMGGMQPGNYTY